VVEKIDIITASYTPFNTLDITIIKPV